MKLKQLFEVVPATKTGTSTGKVKEGAQGSCGGKNKCSSKKVTKSENEELTAITDKDYATWCKQIGLDGKKVSRADFGDEAFEVLDNDPKLGSASEEKKDGIVSVLWTMHQKSLKGK